MEEYLNQISGYFSQVPMWPLVLLFLVLTFARIYELFNRKSRVNAVKDFHASIDSVLVGLYPEPTNWPKNIDVYLSARLDVMEELVVGFKSNIRQQDLSAYNKDWENYQRFCQEIRDDQCTVVPSDSDHVPDSKKIFYTLVSNILRHAR
ncbi:MAG: hypothetical protein ITD42_05400 [Nitrosospira sp.]|nr:hypothetical protein [Nitrosospira sp.]GDX61622.1 hypothetical protein LBMAG32_11560 [Nitrosomonadaceae bacterium]MBI0414977.1 hypothetical protein [Nitrosospira sp.]MBI0417229.1 hypothetical protein [Nitrosospira sp.]MBI0418706.1 hypothetical protein [Nitrosospira sp.]